MTKPLPAGEAGNKGRGPRMASRLAALFVLAFVFCFFPPEAPAQQNVLEEIGGPSWSLEEPEPIRVFLDPGHGGPDLGARGARMTLEKNVTLKIARLVKEKLAADERLDVVISRNGDEMMSMAERMDAANSMRPALYLGIHTGGGPSPRSHPAKVFINAAGEAALEDSSAWQSQNRKYAKKNEDLARAITSELKNAGMERGIDTVRTGRLFLGGLAMPAAIVEPFDLSNPADELGLEDEKRVSRIANALAMAIVDFLMRAGEL